MTNELVGGFDAATTDGITLGQADPIVHLGAVGVEIVDEFVDFLFRLGGASFHQPQVRHHPVHTAHNRNG